MSLAFISEFSRSESFLRNMAKTYFPLIPIVLLAYFVLNSPVFAKNCIELFSASHGSKLTHLNNATNSFISYFDSLLEKRVIGERELSHFMDSLKVGQLINPIDEAKAELKSESYEHFKGMEEYVGRNDLDLDTILEWALKRSKEKDKEKEDRKEVARETKERIHQEIEWGFVLAGDFMMGEEGKKVPVTLTHPFEAMTTPVTQRMWFEVMGKNPLHFGDGENSIVVNMNGKLIEMQPDHPVENITFWSMLVFANKLSEKEGLKPAYDLSEIVWKEDTWAEDGTLDIESGEIKINANGGVYNPYLKDTYYQAEGYRLPTEAEQEYLLRAAGTANGKYHFGDDEKELKDYAWFEENSGKSTHPVGELLPLNVEGSNFYDLYGNIWERGWDYYERNLEGGGDPVGPASGSGRVMRGGSWGSSARYLRSANRLGVRPSFRGDDVGFRLVRTLR